MRKETAVSVRVFFNESTSAGHQRKGYLVVAEIDKGKRYFQQQDLERFKKEYKNLPD